MGFYSNFSEQDLIISYKNQIDHQGKANKEILEEIYQEEEATIIINNENNTVIDQAGFYNINGNNSNNYNIPNSVIDNLQDYIRLLKEEITRLKKEKK